MFTVENRESPLLLSENALSKEKEFLIKVMQYELSRQWFGSLVTCALWDYLWMNEGFATYFQYFAAAKVIWTRRICTRL